MNNIDDWLNSLTVPTEEETPNTQTLTDNDFNDILSSVGFQEPSFDEAEEVQEEPQEEIRDLDAEEDDNWQEAIDSGGVVPVSSSITSEEEHSLREFENLDYEIHLAPVNIDNLNERTRRIIDRAVQEIVEENNPQTEEISSVPAQTFIPPNSPTLLMDDTNARFSGTEWFNEIQKKNIIIAGIGGIGRLKKFLYLCTE